MARKRTPTEPPATSAAGSPAPEGPRAGSPKSRSPGGKSPGATPKQAAPKQATPKQAAPKSAPSRSAPSKSVAPGSAPRPRKSAPRRPRGQSASGPTAAGLLKELYDSIAAPILGITLAVAVLAWFLNLAVAALAHLAGTEPASLWQLAASTSGLRTTTVRLALFSALHLTVVAAAWRPVQQVRAAIAARRRTTKRAKAPRAAARLPDGLRRALGAAQTVLVTALLVVFLIQPTLVPLRVHRHAWIERLANLVDGTASASVVDSVVAVVRWAYAPPVRPEMVVDAGSFDADLSAESIPLMDRWDRYLLDAAGGDRDLAAKTKAFMWVESGGRQYAISATGCAGLMQFCASTAQRRPFHGIFGTGRVSACGCEDCSVPHDVRIALETDPEAADRHRDTFPCDLSDARFDPERSIRAGVAYVRELGDRVGGSLPLMYVGYNSGPGVARAVHRALGERDGATIDDLRPHLAPALRPYYGARAEPRADGLIRVHLPKLMAAYERFRRETP